MNEQALLTNYFTAAKSRQHLHAAKRRKIVCDARDSIQKGSEKPVDAVPMSPSVLMSTSKATPTASQKTKGGDRLTRKRSSHARRTRRNVVPEENGSEVVSYEATSVEDDHQVGRPRKQRAATLMVSSSQSPGQSKPAECTVTTPGPKNACIDNVSVESETKPSVIGTQERIGLKVDPWISEQAKLVLASRGKRAVEKSLGQNQLPGNSSMKNQKPRPVETKEIPKPQKKSIANVGKLKADIPRLHQGSTASSQNLVANLKESRSKLPAFKRFSHLLEAKQPKASGVTQNLTLPYHFKMLEEFFRCVDVVLSLKQKRYETCTFEKLKTSVQEMCRKKFEKKHLAQMKTVYPMAFVFHQENGLSGQKKSEYQLTIDFNLNDLQADQKKKEYKFVESSILIARQKHFKQELLKITMNHHREFLKKNYPLLSVEDKAIMRWHPCFRVDEVPEIGMSPLPEPPQLKMYSTAQDVLDKARENMAQRVEKSLNLVAQKSKESNKKVNKDVLDKKDAQSKTQNPSLKGISQSLIDKIRQKEEKKVQESMTVDPLIVQKRVMVQRLPELCRILKTYFVSERKAAIPLEDASNKLAESCITTLSPVQVEKHLKLLSELAPESISIMHVRKCPYVKLKKNININNLVEKLKSKEIN